MTKRKTETELKSKVEEMNKKPPVVKFAADPIPVRIDTSSDVYNDSKKPAYTPPPAWKIVLNWLLFLIVIAGIVALFKYATLPKLNLKSYEIIILAFSCAFVWVQVLKWGVTKPFNCVTCMSGWFALIFGCWSIGWHGIIYMPVAMTMGAIYLEIRHRYL